MGQTLWVDSEGRVEDDPLADNSIMLRLDEQLQALAEKLGISKLNVFYNYSVMAKEFGESLPQSWFDPDAPLATVVALRKHLDKHPENLQFAPSRSQLHWPTQLMAELNRCEESLSDSKMLRRKVRFLIVP